MRTWPLLFLVGCDLALTLECPVGPLDDADLPCLCQGAIAESVSCGTLTCTDFGLEVGKGECDPTSDTGKG